MAGCIEMSIALHPGAWRQGIATHAVEALARHARDHCRLERIVAAVDEPNERSHRLMLRSAFQRIGEGPGPKHRLVYYARNLAT
jgi:RimJ/RimL family protein N-acetyltransferase